MSTDHDRLRREQEFSDLVHRMRDESPSAFAAFYLMVKALDAGRPRAAANRYGEYCGALGIAVDPEARRGLSREARKSAQRRTTA